MHEMRTGFAAVVAVAAGANSACGSALVPEGLRAGENYHLFFVTEGTRDATSTDIADYNAFVQAEAERPGAVTEHFGIDWFAVGSTATVDARDNAPMVAPVYLLAPDSIFGDTFVGEPQRYFPCCPWPLDVTQFGQPTADANAIVMNGTSDSGEKVAGFALGDANVASTIVWGCELGACLSFGPAGEGAEVPRHMYALSEMLTVPPHLKAGDADMDLDFDQQDLVQVLRAGKYLTGHTASWGEGDWDGAPGGSPGNPPQGNGFFDQIDLIAALNETYLRGPYAALSSNPGDPNDEQTSIGNTYMTGPYSEPSQCDEAQRFTGIVSQVVVPGGVRGDGQTSIIYDPTTGEVAVDVPADVQLTSINVDSEVGVFTGDPARNLGGSFDNDSDYNLFKATFGTSFGSISFGNVAPPGLAYGFVLDDLSAVGSLEGGGGLGPVDLVYLYELIPGDANQDFRFDQQDLVQVLRAAKYLTGRPATWGEGDWDGGPGGYPGEPPAGDGLFDQKDIVAAMQTGTYLSGAYAAIRPGGVRGDEQASIVYNARTGEVSVDAPAGIEMTWIDIDSAACVFTREPAEYLDGSFDNETDCNIFKATFGSSFGPISFGNVAQPGLSEDFVAKDLTVAGLVAHGREIDLIYIPEPSTLALALAAAIGFGVFVRWQVRTRLTSL